MALLLPPALADDLAAFTEFVGGDALEVGPLELTLQQDRAHLDPPELWTVAYGESDGLHWGYFVDDPDHPTPLVASTFANDAYRIAPTGENLFEALRRALEEADRDTRAYAAAEPDDAYEQWLGELDELRGRLMSRGSAPRPETGAAYLDRYPVDRQATAPTADGMGVVVPASTYRAVDGADAFAIGQPEPSPAAMAAYRAAGHAALDDGYPGAALKVGRDLWPHDEGFDDTCALLDQAYGALGRTLLQETLADAAGLRQRQRRR